MLGRKKQREEQAEGQREARAWATRHLLHAAAEITFPGDSVTPETVRQAAQMAGMQAVTESINNGASPNHCARLMELFVQSGEVASTMFVEGGAMHGATAPALVELLKKYEG
ncbi:hypothetical protein F0U44_02830 [Nocardioides humilatus]|uniref:Uncharacterized protein n=1 Tax=Nocardioides humilatus TaxID=2607660 RepID=A0A5B1LLB7_9ACTN|nr:hypothetical protein [Nocardioides humilatus]KAA1421264.1 hypothetical protein F0U44_02830 [Nocardioides humilatus]